MLKCDRLSSTIGRGAQNIPLSLFASQNITDIEDVVVVLVVIALVVHRLGWLCQDTSRVIRWLILEFSVAVRIG